MGTLWAPTVVRVHGIPTNLRTAMMTRKSERTTEMRAIMMTVGHELRRNTLVYSTYVWRAVRQGMRCNKGMIVRVILHWGEQSMQTAALLWRRRREASRVDVRVLCWQVSGSAGSRNVRWAYC